MLALTLDSLHMRCQLPAPLPARRGGAKQNEEGRNDTKYGRNHLTNIAVFLAMEVLFLSACSSQETAFPQTAQSDDGATSSSIVTDGESSPVSEAPTSSISAMTESTQYAALSEFQPNGALEFLRVDSLVDGYASQEGYYRMVARTDASNNLRYIDFATKQEVYLCSQPNCTHDSDACTAWFPTAIGLHKAIPVADKVFLIHGGSLDYAEVLGENSLPGIDIMEPDGSNRKRLFTFPANCRIAPLVLDSMARDNEYLYFCVQTYTEESVTRTLCAVSSRTGKVFSITDLPEVEEKIVGCDGTALIFSYMPHAYEVGTKASEVLAEIDRFDLQTKEVTHLLERPYIDLGECQDGLYWVISVDGSLRSYDLETGELLSEKTVSHPEGAVVSQLQSDGLYDGKWMVHSHRPSPGDQPAQLDYYAVDVETGAALPLEYCFTDEGGTKYPGIVVAQVGDTFLFVYDAERSRIDYPNVDGTTGEITCTIFQYAALPVSDFWNNSKDYVPIVELLE